MLRANSEKDLASSLAVIDIAVSPRGDGRTSDETEQWSICRLLATLNKQKRIQFPFKLEKFERPDYVYSVNGTESIGIEVTEVVHQDFAKMQTLPEAQDENSVLDRSLFRWGDPPRSLSDLREIASKTKLTGPGWKGDEVEVEFVQGLLDRTSAKTKKLNESTFNHFAEDWLLIYENLFLPFLNLPMATAKLRIELGVYFGGKSFDRIFIESGKRIVELTPMGINTYELCDLW